MPICKPNCAPLAVRFAVRFADLQTELREERNFSFQQRVHISTLESRYRKAEKLLKMLPPEVVREVERREKQAERLSR